MISWVSFVERGCYDVEPSKVEPSKVELSP